MITCNTCGMPYKRSDNYCGTQFNSFRAHSRYSSNCTSYPNGTYTHKNIFQDIRELVGKEIHGPDNPWYMCPSCRAGNR